jgi:hypothetical protein
MNGLKTNTYSNTGDTIVFKELPGNSYYINSPCFLTIPNRTILLNGVYLKAEGTHFDAIKILNVHFESGFIYLIVQDLSTKRIYQIDHIVGEHYPCIWWLLNWEYFENEMVKRVKESINNNCQLEFDF